MSTAKRGLYLVLTLVGSQCATTADTDAQSSSNLVSDGILRAEITQTQQLRHLAEAQQRQIQSLEAQLQALNRDIAQDRERIHVLRAEWSHFNEPDRLRALAGKHLDMIPVHSEQVVERGHGPGLRRVAGEAVLLDILFVALKRRGQAPASPGRMGALL